MSGTAILELQGVLRADGGGPIPEGLVLYAALAQSYRVVLVAEQVEDDHWLKQNGLAEHAQLLVGEMALAVQQARGRFSMDVRMVVSPSPETVAECMHAGVTSMLFAHPRFARPEFRDDIERPPGTMREWDTILKEIDDQRKATTRTPTATD